MSSDSLHTIDQELRELEVREDFHDAWVVHRWHQDPLGEVTETVVLADQLANLLEVHLELLETLRFRILLGNETSNQDDYLRSHIIKPLEQRLKLSEMPRLINL